jgi:signal transduction histidine kinase
VSRRNWAFDIGLAAAAGVLGQLEAWFGIGSSHRQGPLWIQSLLYGITALLLVARRLRPLAILTLIATVSMVEFVTVGSPEGFAVSVAPLIATYTVANRLEWRRSWIALALSTVLWVSWAAFDPTNVGPIDFLGSLVWLTPAFVAWLLGALIRSARLNAEQRRINERQRAAQAVAEERNQIARELHDVVGHSVSVMTVQVSAVRRRLTPEQVVERQTLETVEAVGREALAEMRRMVGTLRHSAADPELAPTPGLDQLDRLVAKFQSAGLPVVATVTGEPDRLSPGLDLTAYRLVQEGLTNALRHARQPRRVDVEIDVKPAQLELAVRDDGRPGSGDSAEAGNGLMGMRERVALYDGCLTARARPEGGFELVATLPLTPR